MKNLLSNNTKWFNQLSAKLVWQFIDIGLHVHVGDLFNHSNVAESAKYINVGL